MWPALLHRVDELHLYPQTTKYYNTLFRQNGSLQGGFFATELYVCMKQEDKIYAFRVDVRWDVDRWLEETVDTNLYIYEEIGDEEIFLTRQEYMGAEGVKIVRTIRWIAEKRHRVGRR